MQDIKDIEEEAKENRECAGSWSLDRSEKFGQDRDTLGLSGTGRFETWARVRIDSAMIGCDRILAETDLLTLGVFLRSNSQGRYISIFKVFRISMEIFVYLLSEKKENIPTVQIRRTTFHEIQSLVQISPHRCSAWLSSPSPRCENVFHISNFLQIRCRNGNF